MLIYPHHDLYIHSNWCDTDWYFSVIQIWCSYWIKVHLKLSLSPEAHTGLRASATGDSVSSSSHQKFSAWTKAWPLPTEVRNKNQIGFLPGFNRERTEPFASAAACKALWWWLSSPKAKGRDRGGKLAAPLTIHYLELVLYWAANRMQAQSSSCRALGWTMGPISGLYTETSPLQKFYRRREKDARASVRSRNNCCDCMRRPERTRASLIKREKHINK